MALKRKSDDGEEVAGEETAKKLRLSEEGVSVAGPSQLQRQRQKQLQPAPAPAPAPEPQSTSTRTSPPTNSEEGKPRQRKAGKASSTTTTVSASTTTASAPPSTATQKRRNIRKLVPPRPFPLVPPSVSATGPRSAHSEGKNFICITRQRTGLAALMRRCKDIVVKDGYKTLHLSAMGAAIPLLLQLTCALPPILPFAASEIHTRVVTGTCEVQDEVLPEDDDEDVSIETRLKSTLRVVLTIGDGEFEGDTSGPARRGGEKGKGKGKGTAKGGGNAGGNGGGNGGGSAEGGAGRKDRNKGRDKGKGKEKEKGDDMEGVVYSEPVQEDEDELMELL